MLEMIEVSADDSSRRDLNLREPIISRNEAVHLKDQVNRTCTHRAELTEGKLDIYQILVD
jgi:hypothetical protein